jgi:blocked-early-in-transport protein 1
MAAAGNRVAVFKLAGIVVAVVVVLWWIKGFFF